MRSLLLILLFIVSGHLGACMCFTPPLDEKTFEDYDFIAHVKVTGVVRPLGPYPNEFSYHSTPKMIRYELIELYRGEDTGWFYEGAPETSCGMFIRTGEEWIISGTKGKGGAISTDSCSPSDPVRHKNGLTVWQYGLHKIYQKFLRKYCGMQIAPLPALTGPDTLFQFFPDGTLESMNCYQDGARNGLHTLYYPDGQLGLSETYKMGTQVEESFYYNEKGCLLESWKYNSRGDRLEHVEVFDYAGRTVITNYNDTNRKTEITYHPDGRRVEVHKEGFISRETKVFLTGKLIYHLAYDGEYGTELVRIDVRPDVGRNNF